MVTQQPVLATPYAKRPFISDLSICEFYSTTDLPGFGTVEGYWDLRGREREYLGSVALAGKRVLEIGPANGGLTFFMEREGAAVVSVEAPSDYRMDYCWDIPSDDPSALESHIDRSQKGLARLHNAYWLAHRLLRSRAKVHYGSAYGFPAALGLFDIAVVASVLLHNKNPFSIIEGVARVADVVVVVEVMPAISADGYGVSIIREGNEPFDGWFLLHPYFTARLLKTMGFVNSTITYHTQRPGGRPGAVETAFYTVVARRPSHGIAGVAG